MAEPNNGRGMPSPQEIRYSGRELDRLVSTLKDQPGDALTLVVLAGASADRKAITAEAIAKQLQRELYRVDVSQVVGAYIGETEKNLDRVFDEASRSGAVLLFDEADALFGKRTEVKPPGDRDDSAEMSALLRRLDACSGIVVMMAADPEPVLENVKRLRRPRKVVILDR